MITAIPVASLLGWIGTDLPGPVGRCTELAPLRRLTGPGRTSPITELEAVAMPSSRHRCRARGEVPMVLAIAVIAFLSLVLNVVLLYNLRNDGLHVVEEIPSQRGQVKSVIIYPG